MIYSKSFFYTLEKEDEIIKFDRKVHDTFMYHNDLFDAEELGLSSEELLIANFFYEHACEVWNTVEHHPDHSVGMIITVEELSDVLHLKKEKVREYITHLLEKEIIGIVLTPDNKFAYHFVL